MLQWKLASAKPHLSVVFIVETLKTSGKWGLRFFLLFLYCHGTCSACATLPTFCFLKHRFCEVHSLPYSLSYKKFGISFTRLVLFLLCCFIKNWKINIFIPCTFHWEASIFIYISDSAATMLNILHYNLATIVSCYFQVT